MGVSVGELNAEQLEETTMSKNNRVLKRITIEDMESAAKIVHSLMGEQVQTRRDFLNAKAKEAKIDI